MNGRNLAVALESMNPIQYWWFMRKSPLKRQRILRKIINVLVCRKVLVK